MAARRAHEDDDGPAKKKPKIVKTLHDKHIKKRLIVVLERSSLEAVKAGKSYELLNCDRHKHLMKKFNKDPSQCRPDITHQCLLMLFDSPLNRAGLLQVFVHTEKNVLIQINPQTRVPRTFDRFCGLMVQLLHKLSISASDGPQKLLKVIKNPVSDHLPAGCKKIGTSFSATKCINPRELADTEEPVVVVIGAMAHGKVDTDYVEEEVSISKYPLSAALTCAKICSGFEEAWGIV
ncbi:ribosomal RNA small subunit methyltransferase NEP1-like isoform X1 [Asterias rubens]|uniref:ribosomal RNA small subunit methyltransferase NEP1-like isoform X1 n=1 Tax=Asterias rubens TaxID=7604 RepID=UPI0014558EF1|nr:ribosomal RNA small subunit methyltransferase NEP1-like isoform X1 [Asterias rubens]